MMSLRARVSYAFCITMSSLLLLGCGRGDSDDATWSGQRAGAGGQVEMVAGAGGETLAGTGDAGTDRDSDAGTNGDSGGDSDGDADTDHVATLEDLGVDTRVDTKTDPVGNELDDDYNPTLKPVFQLMKRSEIFIAGTQGQGASAEWTPTGRYNAVLDWPKGGSGFSPDNTPSNDSDRFPKATAAGDLDGDGIDEIFVAYVRISGGVISGTQVPITAELAFRVMKKDEAGWSSSAEQSVATYSEEDIAGYLYSDAEAQAFWWMNNFSAVCGDMDGNGQAETAIAFNGSVFLVGDSASGFALLKSLTYEIEDDTSEFILRKSIQISAGDLDNNGEDELVVVQNTVDGFVDETPVSHLYFYSGTDLEEELQRAYPRITGRAAVGDLDADGLNEVLLAGSRSFVSATGSPSTGTGSEPPEIIAIDVLDQSMVSSDGASEFDVIADSEGFPCRPLPPLAGYSPEEYSSVNPTPISAIADFDGDGKKDILVENRLYKNLSLTGGTFVRKSVSNVEDLDIYGPANATYRASVWDSSLAVGDVDGDGKAEVAYIAGGASGSDETPRELYVLGYDDEGKWVRKGTGDILDNHDYYPSLTMGDFDGDSIVVEYVGSETLFSDPHPIAVLASNPFWEGVEMEGETSFGRTSGGEVEKTTSVGFSAGFTVGFEAEAPFNLVRDSVKASFESSFDWTASQSVAVQESYTYSTVNEDKVIFTSIPYDVYYYHVIRAPDPEMVDTMLTVNLPRRASTVPVERGFYNTHNGAWPDIDGTVLSHTVGNPLSYPTLDQAEDLIRASGEGGGICSTEAMTVGQGSGSQAIEMSVEKKTGTGQAFDISTSIEAEVGVGGFVLGANSGFHYGESLNITSSEETIYGGEVSNISSEDFTSGRNFSWGLFSYSGKVQDEGFIVVQYYVESI